MKRKLTPIWMRLLGLLVAASTASVPARADFTSEDLLGPYTFSSSTDDVLVQRAGNVADPDWAEMVGVLDADGAGNVTGMRTFQRPIKVEATIGTPTHKHVETIEQTVTGTYEVSADGTGTMWLIPAPNPPWEFPSDQAVRITFTGGGPEILRFVLAEDGRSFRFTHELRATRQEASTFRDTHFLLVGIAETQDPLEIPEPEPDPRIDELIDLLEGQDARIDELAAQNDVLKAQLCEVLRLLNTPQGQRVSDSPDVVDACGTAFAWNAEGTEGPRRGR